MSLTRQASFTVYGIEAVFCLACTSADLAILLHLSFVQKKKGFCYVLALSASSFLGLLFWALVPAYELNVFPKTYSFLYYRCLVYPWLDNIFFCANAYVIVVMGVDRFIALYKPHSYCMWAEPVNRVSVLFCCFSLATAVTSKWYDFVIISGSYDNGTAYCSENVPYTHSTSYRIGKNCAILLQYYIPAIIMIIFTILNAKKAKKLRSQYASNQLRIENVQVDLWAKRYGRMTNVSIGLAVIFCLTNLPFSIFEFDFREDTYRKLGFQIFQFVTNVIQIFSSQINIVLVCYYSKAYRQTASDFVLKIIKTYENVYFYCLKKNSKVFSAKECDVK